MQSWKFADPEGNNINKINIIIIIVTETVTSAIQNVSYRFACGLFVRIDRLVAWTLVEIDEKSYIRELTGSYERDAETILVKTRPLWCVASRRDVTNKIDVPG